MAVKKLLDENSLLAIKTYIDTYGGKVDDVKINNTSILASKIANIVVDGNYNASTNKIATISSITGAINALDVSNITGFGTGKTLATLSEIDGKISATFQDIQITESQVTNLISDLALKVPITRTIAGIDLIDDITSSELITALGLTDNIIFVGVSTTDPKGSSGATVSGHTTWKKGEVVLYNNKEFILNGDTNVADNWVELGDEGSYALKTITISAGSGLSGGGTLEANRTISHATPTGATTTSSGFYKFSTDSFGHVNGTTAVAKADLTALGVADDSLVVHKTGSETISGTKTMTDGIYLSSGQISTGGSTGIHFNSNGTIYGHTSSGHTFKLDASEAILTLGSEGTITGELGTNTKYGLSNIIRTIKPVGTATPTTYTYSFPEQSGTLATTDDLTNFVIGPSSAEENNIATYNGTTGKIIKDSGIYANNGVIYRKNYALLLSGGPGYGSANAISIYGGSQGIELTPVVPTSTITTITSSLGTSTNKWTNLYLSGNLSDGTNSKTIAQIATHIDDSNIHVTSANKTTWNNKISNVRVLEVTSSTEGAGYQKLQQTSDGSTYNDIVACLSYNEAWAILTA